MSSTYKGKPWSYTIIGAIITFMIFTLSLVYIMMKQKVEVLYPDYYERTLQYDEVQKRLNEGQKPENLIIHTFSKNKDTLYFQFATRGSYSGNIAFIKPDNSASDMLFPFSVDSTIRISLPVKQLPKGNWGVEMEWTNGEKNILTRFKLTL